jgi:hypothetical protein
MPEGKPAGVPCVNLDPQTYLCRIWGTDIYPDVCREFAATLEICGTSREEALATIRRLEEETRPPSDA